MPLAANSRAPSCDAYSEIWDKAYTGVLYLILMCVISHYPVLHRSWSKSRSLHWLRFLPEFLLSRVGFSNPYVRQFRRVLLTGRFLRVSFWRSPQKWKRPVRRKNRIPDLHSQELMWYSTGTGEGLVWGGYMTFNSSIQMRMRILDLYVVRYSCIIRHVQSSASIKNNLN